MFDIKENLKKLPETPGVYMHKDKLGNVIYVGKAVNLKRRVSSYFVNSASHSSKVRSMVKNIEEFEYITCKTEMEALILECNLIKKYEPKYNVLLRDDKTYPYIKLTMNEDYPRLLKTRLVKKDGARYFGPYSDVAAVNRALELLNKLFKLKRCSATSFPEGFKPCLNYHIGECRGICTGLVDREEYMKDIERLTDLLNGKDKSLENELKEQMKEASENLEFEKAAVLRDQIEALKALRNIQRVTMVNGKDLDMVFTAGHGENTVVVLFPVRGGKLSGRETFLMANAENWELDKTDSEDYDEYEKVISEFIKQYYSQLANPPSEILIPKPIRDEKIISEMLGTRIHTPERGDKYQLLKLASRDVVEISKSLDIKVETQKEREKELRTALSRILGYEKRGYRVESYDISNTNGVDTVGAMVVFRDLKPVRKDYRRFKIRTVEGPDDYGSLQEMLMRRFRRALENDRSFNELPDLILMDGGRGQVTSAEKVLRALRLEIPVLGMAKDDSHRTRALVNGEGQEILLKDYPLLFKYCGTIQEEVHRFAIDYHRSLHNRNTIGSVLDDIPGIGPKKRNALLNHFETIKDIKEAGREKLMECPGITAKNADSIIEFFGLEKHKQV
ncbi:MAG: excinuclease ABC subunit UvrC [Firmicutes bacterium]|nr:excinuclease ABC subunit UvrC [Bacillota bacterium]MBR3374646.1 excinuclease ABC subunit UvrC [Bacillota bacterium]